MPTKRPEAPPATTRPADDRSPSIGHAAVNYEWLIYFHTHLMNAQGDAYHGHPPGTSRTTVGAILLQLAVKELQLLESNTF